MFSGRGVGKGGTGRWRYGRVEGSEAWVLPFRRGGGRLKDKLKAWASWGGGGWRVGFVYLWWADWLTKTLGSLGTVPSELSWLTTSNITGDSPLYLSISLSMSPFPTLWYLHLFFLSFFLPSFYDSSPCISICWWTAPGSGSMCLHSKEEEREKKKGREYKERAG